MPESQREDKPVKYGPSIGAVLVGMMAFIHGLIMTLAGIGLAFEGNQVLLQ